MHRHAEPIPLPRRSSNLRHGRLQAGMDDDSSFGGALLRRFFVPGADAGDARKAQTLRSLNWRLGNVRRWASAFCCNFGRGVCRQLQRYPVHASPSEVHCATRGILRAHVADEHIAGSCLLVHIRAQGSGLKCIAQECHFQETSPSALSIAGFNIREAALK